MSDATLMAFALLAAPMLWVGSRIVFSAYFSAKAVYQRQLMDHLSRGGEKENGQA